MPWGAIPSRWPSSFARPSSEAFRPRRSPGRSRAPPGLGYGSRRVLLQQPAGHDHAPAPVGALLASGVVPKWSEATWVDPWSSCDGRGGAFLRCPVFLTVVRPSTEHPHRLPGYVVEYRNVCGCDINTGSTSTPVGAYVRFSTTCKFEGFGRIEAQVSETAPRARGDGPCSSRYGARSWYCSPRTRGWTLATDDGAEPLVLLPAHAGMDPRGRPSNGRATSAPRARGDGPVAVGPARLKAFSLQKLPQPAGAACCGLRAYASQVLPVIRS